MKQHAIALIGIFSASVSLADDELSCHIGPIQLELGGAPWQVSSCDDGRSLVFAAMKDNPAMPFFFFIFRDEETSQITGEGTGSREYSAAAFAELEKMSAARLDELVQATKDAVVSK